MHRLTRPTGDFESIYGYLPMIVFTPITIQPFGKILLHLVKDTGDVGGIIEKFLTFSIVHL